MAEQHLWKLSLLRKFIAKHGWAALKRGTVVPPGVHLYSYVAIRRNDWRNDRIESWLAAECERIPGWSWAPFRDGLRKSLDHLRAYVCKHGWEGLGLPRYVGGIRLDRWVGHRREEYKRGVLARWLVDALEAIPGWSWDPRTAKHARNLRALRGHVARHGWSAGADPKIERWVHNVRALRRRREIPRWLEAALETIPGWRWNPRRERQATRVAQLATYVAKHGWERVRESLVVRGVPLGVWVSYCRARYREGILPAATIAGLEAIPGWSWTAQPGGDGTRRNRRGRFVRRDR